MKVIEAQGEEESDIARWRTSLLLRLARGDSFVYTSQEVNTSKKQYLDCRPTFETPQKDGHKRGTSVQTPSGSSRTGKSGKKPETRDEDKTQEKESEELAIQVNRQLNVDSQPLPKRDSNRFALLRTPEVEKEETSASENEDEADIIIESSTTTRREREVSSIITEQVMVTKAVSTEEELKERAETATKERRRLLELPTAEEEPDIVNGIPTSSEPGNFGRTMFVHGLYTNKGQTW